MDELLQILNRAEVRYVLVGGQAMRLWGMPRFSMDWDFFIPPQDADNFAQLNALLAEELDLPIIPLGLEGENFVQTYQTRWGVVQFHLALPGVPGFDEVERQAIIRENEHGTAVRVLSGEHLLASKQAANRPQDQPDIDFLTELQRLGKL